LPIDLIDKKECNPPCLENYTECTGKINNVACAKCETLCYHIINGRWVLKNLFK